MYIVIFLAKVLQSSAGWTDKKEKKNFSRKMVAWSLPLDEGIFWEWRYGHKFYFYSMKGQVCDGKEQTASRSEKTAL